MMNAIGRECPRGKLESRVSDSQAGDGSVQGTLLINESMAKHTSWRVGGPADRFFKPANLQDLCGFLATLPDDEKIYWIGLGSNLLVRDGGVRGTVIYTTGLLDEMTLLDENIVRVEAGVPCAKVARFAARQNLVGCEFLAGIPGTMGGALAMNAGAFGGQTWEVVERVEMVNARGDIVTRQPGNFEVSYREVKRPANEWFVAAFLKLQPGDGEAAKQKIKQLLAKRGDSQPTQLPSCGSVFRNPEGDFAARLIEASGLKGECRGDACVSEKHANFIVNQGQATAAQIEALIHYVQQTVKQKQGVSLKPEVHIMGEPLQEGDG